MAMFAKRHYEAIAQAMQNTHPGPDMVLVRPWYAVCEELADMFARDNPEFNAVRFQRACEPGANVQARS